MLATARLDVASVPHGPAERICSGPDGRRLVLLPGAPGDEITALSVPCGIMASGGHAMPTQRTQPPRSPWPLRPTGFSAPYTAGRGFKVPQPPQPRPRSVRDDAQAVGVAMGRGFINALGGRERPYLEILSTPGAGNGPNAPISDWRTINFRQIRERASTYGASSGVLDFSDDDDDDDQTVGDEWSGVQPALPPAPPARAALSAAQPRIDPTWASEPLGAARRS